MPVSSIRKTGALLSKSIAASLLDHKLPSTEGGFFFVIMNQSTPIGGFMSDLIEALKITPQQQWGSSEAVARAFLDDVRVTKIVVSIISKNNSNELIIPAEIKQTVFQRLIEKSLFDKVDNVDGFYSYMYRICELCILNALDDFFKQTAGATSLDALLEERDTNDWGPKTEEGYEDDEDYISDEAAATQQQANLSATERLERKIQRLGWSSDIPRSTDEYQQVGRPRGSKSKPKDDDVL